MDDKWISGALFALLALGIHRSVMLPIVAILVGIFLIKDVRYAIAFWIASIFLSLVFGDAVTSLFASLGFDDRMTQYTQTINEPTSNKYAVYILIQKNYITYFSKSQLRITILTYF